MEKLNNSNFELLTNILENIELDAENDNIEAKEKLFAAWEEIIGPKIAKYSKLFEISADSILTIACADSYIANELYFEKEKIFTLIAEKAEELGIKIEDIKFNYKIWKEK